MQRGAGAARRAVSRAAAARLKNPDVATEVQQGVATSDFIPDQGANNSQWLRNFSAMSWTSSVTLQNINPRVRSSLCHFYLLCTYIYLHIYVHTLIYFWCLLALSLLAQIGKVYIWRSIYRALSFNANCVKITF